MRLERSFAARVDWGGNVKKSSDTHTLSALETAGEADRWSRRKRRKRAVRRGGVVAAAAAAAAGQQPSFADALQQSPSPHRQL